jgi:hypothetical protein
MMYLMTLIIDYKISINFVKLCIVQLLTKLICLFFLKIEEVACKLALHISKRSMDQRNTMKNSGV